jgi:hypothetical protein
MTAIFNGVMITLALGLRQCNPCPPFRQRREIGKSLLRALRVLNTGPAARGVLQALPATGKARWHRWGQRRSNGPRVYLRGRSMTPSRCCVRVHSSGRGRRRAGDQSGEGLLGFGFQAVSAFAGKAFNESLRRAPAPPNAGAGHSMGEALGTAESGSSAWLGSSMGRTRRRSDRYRPPRYSRRATSLPATIRVIRAMSTSGRK